MKRKISKYQKIILEVLEEEVIIRPNEDMKDIVIADKEKHHYQLLKTGWTEKQNFVDKVLIHFHIVEETGKIWLLANNTDNPITEELVRRGIPPSEIVIGFQPPIFRSVSGYAVN